MARTPIGTTEAAERCGVDRTTFFRWVQLGQIEPVTKLPGRTGALLFDPDEVDALAAEKALRAKHGACPTCPYPTWHNGDPCPNTEAVAS
jgi:hypothetical protein